MMVTLANESRCEDFKNQFAKFDYLWKQDLQATLQQFITDNGVTLPDGTRDDPPLAKFEEQIVKYKNVASEIASFKDTMTMGYVKVNAKPLRQALSTWASKWVYLFTHYLQVRHNGSRADMRFAGQCSSGQAFAAVLWLSDYLVRRTYWQCRF